MSKEKETFPARLYLYIIKNLPQSKIKKQFQKSVPQILIYYNKKLLYIVIIVLIYLHNNTT